MKTYFPLGRGRFVIVEVPVDFKFTEIPKVIARLIVFLRTCASTCTQDK